MLKRLDYPLLLILLLAAGLRLFHLGTFSMWFDEAYSWHLAQQSAPAIVDLAKIDNTPPVYHLLLRFWLSSGAESDFTIRLLSAIFGILAVYMTYKLGKEIFSRPAGLTAAFLAAVSFQLVRYSQENRMYSLQCLLALISVYCFVLILHKSPKWLLLIGWLLANVLNFYNHLFTVFLLMAQWIYFLIYFKRNKRVVVPWLGVNLILLLFCLPWLPVIFRQMGAIQAQYWVLPASVKEIFKVGFHLLGGSDLGDRYAIAGLLNLPFIAAGIFGFRTLLKDKLHPDKALPSLLFFASLIMVYLISLSGQSLFYYRYFIFLLPLLYIFFAAGITGLAKNLWRYMLLILLALVSAIFLYFYYTVPGYSEPLRTPLKEVIASLQQKAGKGDVVIHLSPGNIGMHTFYTSARYTNDSFRQYIWRDTPPPFFFGASLYRPEWGITDIGRLQAPERIFVIVSCPGEKRFDSAGLPVFIRPGENLSGLPPAYPDNLWLQLSEKGYLQTFLARFGELTLVEFHKGDFLENSLPDF